MTEKKPKNGQPKPKPEREFQSGDVTASVFLRVTNTGYRYRDFVLGRQWRNAAGKVSTGSSFFGTAEHEEHIQHVVRQAVAYIREQENGAVDGTATSAPGKAR